MSLDNNQNLIDLGGKSFDNYLLLEKISKGAFGEVYLARNLKMTDQFVAIKFIRSTHQQSIDAELTALQSVKDRNIVQFHTPISPHELKTGGYQYVGIVMEFLGGGSLSDALKKAGRKLDFSVIHQGMSEIAKALREVHGRNFWHRDLKPSNILLQPTVNSMPAFVLADFGITKLLERPEVVTNFQPGTYRYMAPELWRENPYQTVPDKRTDIYALGVILYELVTGQHLFTVKDKSSSKEWADQHLYGKRTRPSQVSGAEDTPLELENLIFHAIEQNPQNRFQNMGEFIKALEALPTFPTNPDRMNAAEFGELARRIETETLSRWQPKYSYKIRVSSPDKPTRSDEYFGDITVGTAPDADLQLTDAPSIASQQLKLTPESAALMVTNLAESAFEITLGDTALQPNSPTQWPQGDFLYLPDGYDLLLENVPHLVPVLPPNAEAIVPVGVEELKRVLAQRSFGIQVDPGLVDLSKDVFRVWITPEDTPPLAYTASISATDGLQESWFVVGAEQTIRAGERQAIDIAVRIPPGTVVQDRKHQLTVTVFPVTKVMPPASIIVPVIVPQKESFNIDIQPKGSGNLRRPQTVTPKLNIHNTGNIPVEYDITTSASDNFSVTVHTPKVLVMPGQITQVPIKIVSKGRGSIVESVSAVVRAPSGQEKTDSYTYHYIPRTNPLVSNVLRWFFFILLIAAAIMVIKPELFAHTFLMDFANQVSNFIDDFIRHIRDLVNP
ncbi:MAG: serine/threonine-protein kinase [Anaerolineae bacterium]